MKRRTFLQMVAGMFGAASVGAAAELLAREPEKIAVRKSVPRFRLFRDDGSDPEYVHWVEVQGVDQVEIVDVMSGDESAARWLVSMDSLEVEFPLTAASGPWPV